MVELVRQNASDRALEHGFRTLRRKPVLEQRRNPVTVDHGKRLDLSVFYISPPERSRNEAGERSAIQPAAPLKYHDCQVCPSLAPGRACVAPFQVKPERRQQ